MTKLRVGIVGLGKLGYLHATNIARNIHNADLVAACDASEEKLNQAKDELGVSFLYNKFDEMVNSGNIDAVAIISPSAFHFEHIKTAVEANMPIFCEKPLATTLDEIYKIRDMVEDKKYEKPLMLAFMRRFDQSYMRAKEAIENGAIGKPYLVRCYGLDPIKWVKTAVPFAKHSGGIFLDMAIHDIDLARWFMDSEVKTIYAMGECFVEKGFEAYDDVDNATALMRFENKGMAMFYTSRTCHHGYHIETEIVGTEGTIRVGSNPNKDEVVIFDENGAKQTYKDYFMDRFQDAYCNEVQEFVNCVLENRKPSVGIIDGIRSTEIAYACDASYKNDELVRLENK